MEILVELNIMNFPHVGHVSCLLPIESEHVRSHVTVYCAVSAGVSGRGVWCVIVQERA